MLSIFNTYHYANRLRLSSLWLFQKDTLPAKLSTHINTRALTHAWLVNQQQFPQLKKNMKHLNYSRRFWWTIIDNSQKCVRCSEVKMCFTRAIRSKSPFTIDDSKLKRRFCLNWSGSPFKIYYLCLIHMVRLGWVVQRLFWMCAVLYWSFLSLCV